MAWIYQIWIESDKNGEEIRKHFLSKQEILIDYKRYKIQVYQSGFTGSMITVDGISQYGIQNKNDAIEMTKIGYKLYEILKSAPNFRYALAGIEVDGWRDMNELKEEPEDIESMKGFVIHKKIYDQIQCKVKMEVFAKDYLWLPYEGEK